MTVSLSSSDAQVASVEASVRFTSDYTTGQAIVTTHRLSAPATVTVTATCAACQGTTSRSVTLQVVPALDVSTITVAPSGDIKGGAQATVTVTLTQAAGSAGANVALSTSNPTVCLVPKAVKVAAGQTTITVPISTQAVASPATVTLAAGTLGGGVQKSTTVRVVP